VRCAVCGVRCVCVCECVYACVRVCACGGARGSRCDRGEGTAGPRAGQAGKRVPCAGRPARTKPPLPIVSQSQLFLRALSAQSRRGSPGAAASAPRRLASLGGRRAPASQTTQQPQRGQRKPPQQAPEGRPPRWGPSAVSPEMPCRSGFRHAAVPVSAPCPPLHPPRPGSPPPPVRQQITPWALSCRPSSARNDTKAMPLRCVTLPSRKPQRGRPPPVPNQ
jgi:hypothetical protein